MIRHAHVLLNAPIKIEVEDETPFAALCDAAQGHEHRLSSTSYAVGSAVQGAFREAGGVAWYDGRVVSSDACSVRVRFDEDGEEESYTLPNDRDELRFLRPDAPASGERRREMSSESDAANAQPREESGSDASYHDEGVPPKGKRRESQGNISCAGSGR